MHHRRELRSADPKVDSPRADDAIDDHGHLVQFYESDAFLVESVRDFIVAGFERNETAVIVATKEHRVAIDELLEATDFDLQRLRNEGSYVLLDANETLSRFMVDGEPEPALFSAAVGSRVMRAVESASGVRIFGEMVAVLWKMGNVTGALRLERLWNELAQAHPFSLLCAYPMSDLTDPGSFREVCFHHTRVIPTEGYTALTDADERLRAVAELQQQVLAGQLESRDRAYALNDGLVQGLAAAKMALDLKQYEVATATLSATLDRATSMVSRLLERSARETGPGDLRRKTPSV